MSKWDAEQKVGAMHRAITSDFVSEYHKFKKRLYSEEYQGDGNYLTSALEFSNFIGTFFFDENLIHSAQQLINNAIERKEDLWKHTSWLNDLRRLTDIQFKRKIDDINSAVSRLASIDAKEKEETKHIGIEDL